MSTHDQPPRPAGGTIRSAARPALRLAALAVLAAATLPAQTVIASSTFDTNAEGWMSADLFGRACNSPAPPSHIATGGNPGGFIRSGDVCSTSAFLAPSAYLGDRSATYGGELRFSLRALEDPAGLKNLMSLSGGGLTVMYQSNSQPNPNTWTDFIVSFTAGTWRIVTGSTVGAVATETQLRSILADLTALRIQADWNTGADRSDLDNVSLISPTVTPGVVPEPSTYALLGTGLAGLATVARRRRRA